MATLIINDYETDEIYYVLEFPTSTARFRATDIFHEVRNQLPGEWSTEDFFDALDESDIEYEILGDVEEYRI